MLQFRVSQSTTKIGAHRGVRCARQAVGVAVWVFAGCSYEFDTLSIGGGAAAAQSGSNGAPTATSGTPTSAIATVGTNSSGQASSSTGDPGPVVPCATVESDPIADDFEAAPVLPWVELTTPDNGTARAAIQGGRVDIWLGTSDASFLRLSKPIRVRHCFIALQQLDGTFYHEDIVRLTAGGVGSLEIGIRGRSLDRPDELFVSMTGSPIVTIPEGGATPFLRVTEALGHVVVETSSDPSMHWKLAADFPSPAWFDVAALEIGVRRVEPNNNAGSAQWDNLNSGDSLGNP